MSKEKKVLALKEVLEFAKEKFEEAGERKPIKTYKMSKEVIKLYEEAEAQRKIAKEAKSKASAIAEEMWGKVRRELDYPMADLHLNDEEMTIELYDPED